MFVISYLPLIFLPMKEPLHNFIVLLMVHEKVVKERTPTHFKMISAERSSNKDKNEITKKVSCTGALRYGRVLTRSHNTHENNVLRYFLVQKKTKIASYLLVWGWELSLVRFLNVFRSCFSNKTLIFRQTEMYRLLGHQSRKLLKL